MKAADTAAGQAPRRLPRPALVPGGHRRRRAHHRHRHQRRGRGRPGAGAAVAVGPDLRREQLDHRPTTATAPIRLIPRTKDRIDAHYPGTGMAFTEWNYGGGGHISGAVASADVLGIFGREGVGLADLLGAQQRRELHLRRLPRLPQLRRRRRPLRRHLGAGHDQRHADSSVYAAIDAANHNRVVIVAINKATTAKTTAVKITGERIFSQRQDLHADRRLARRPRPARRSRARPRTPSSTPCRPSR